MPTGRSNFLIKLFLVVLGLFALPSFALAFVNAGSDKTVTWPSSVTMSGSTNENLSGTAWSQKSGPGAASFSPTTGSATPSVSFSEPGVYVLEYCAIFIACDQATVTVNLPTPTLTFDKFRPDCGQTIYTGVANGGPNAAIHYDWTHSDGSTWYYADTQLNGSQTNSSGNMINGPFPDSGGMQVSEGWVKGGTYNVRVRTKKNGMVSPWSSPRSFTFCSTPNLQFRQGSSGAWLSGSGIQFSCGTPIYSRITNAPSNVRMFFRWTSSQGTFYESTQFDAGKNPATDGNGSVISGPFPDNGGPTIAGGWRDGGTYTVETWSPGGSNNDSQAFTLRCSTTPPPPAGCPGGAAKTCSGAQQNQYRCTTGLGREQCRSTTGQWCWESAPSCSAGQSCSGGSCVNPTTPPPPSCNPRTFARPPSGFYNAGGASITSVAPNTQFDILCNYSVSVDDIGVTPVTSGASSCNWVDFVGTSARFRCNGISAPGTYTYECKAGGNPQASANSCFQSNPIGSITVTGGGTPPPPVTPPPAGCSAYNQACGSGCCAGLECRWVGTTQRCVPPPIPPPPPPPPPASLSCSGVSVSASSVYGPSATYDVIISGVTGASNVRVPHWTELNGQNDIGGWPWPAAINQGGGTWRYTVDLSHHRTGNPEYGRIFNHVYLNNATYFCGEAIVQWDESPPQVDLTITNDWTVPATVQVGNSVNFGAIIRNQGNAAPGSITQTYLCLDEGSSTIASCDLNIARNTSNLSPGTSEQEEWNGVWTAVAGTHTYRVCADRGTTQVTESNESNNCVTRTFTVSATPPPPPPQAQNCDNQNYPANQFHVCYFDGIGASIQADSVLAQENEPALAAPTAVISEVPASLPAISHNWGTGAVTPTTRINQVSAVWRGEINFEPGVYVFHVNSDDGVQLRVTGQTPAIIINEWQDQSIDNFTSAPVTITGGPTRVRLRWYEQGGDARIKLWWTFTPIACADVGEACGSGCCSGLMCSAGTCVAPPPPPPPPPCDTVGAACCGNMCDGGLTCDPDLNICINPSGDLPITTLVSPAEGAQINTERKNIVFNGQTSPVMPVEFRWEFDDSASGGDQIKYRLYVLDITSEFPIDSDPNSGCIIDGEYNIGTGCLLDTIDFSTSLGNDQNNGKQVTSSSDHRIVDLHTEHIYAWTVRARSSIDDPSEPAGSIFAERWSDIFDTGFRTFDTLEGVLGGGDIHIKRIDREGNDLGTPSALYDLVTTAWTSDNFSFQKDENPAEFNGLQAGDFFAAYVNYINGYTLRAQVCSHARGSTCTVSPSTLSNPANPLDDLMVCNFFGECFLDDIEIEEAVVQKVVAMYIPECSDGLDGDNDGDVDEDDDGCLDIDGNYNPDDTDEGDEPVGPGGSFLISHNPSTCDKVPGSDPLVCKPGPGHPHIFSDIQLGGANISTATNIRLQSVGGFAGTVQLKIEGMSLDHSPVRAPDGSDPDTLPDDMGDGRPDDPNYSIVAQSKVTPNFNGQNRLSLDVPLAANQTVDTRFLVGKNNIQPGRYLIRITASAVIDGATVTLNDPILLVVGTGTFGYEEQ